MMILIISILAIAVLLFLFYASYSIQSGIYISALCRNPKAEKVVALTFDDGPDTVQTPKVLDILKKYGIKSCFFIIGKKVAGNEDIVRRIKEEGHLLGNHGYGHSGKFPLYSLSKMVKDVEECSNGLEKTTGNRVNLFRPPFGVTNPTIAQMVKKLNLTTIGWNVRTLDTCIKDDNKILKRIERKLSPGSVILLHDSLKSSDTLLEKVIALVYSKGYRCIGIDELFNLKIQ